MEKFNFISIAITQLFSNSGLQDYLVFIIACFGIAIIYNVVVGWVKNKWYF